MKEKFEKYLLHELQIPQHSSILVAVSGGMDSVAMLHLFKQTGAKTGVAHANFRLRGEESDNDAVFVENLAEKYKVPFYCAHFDTRFLADKDGVSVQMAARKLRYKWFSELLFEKHWDYVALAHHMDDQIETFFINLLRGTGISGLKGIPAKNDNLIRPLLPFYRSEIEAYVRENRLDYREDSSNFKSDYLRNRIRHQLIPLLNELQPAFRKIMTGNIAHLNDAESLMREEINKFAAGILKYEKDEVHISIHDLIKSGHGALLLHEILQPCGFSGIQTRQAWQALDALAGKTFFSPTHRLIKDRDKLILQALTDIEGIEEEFEIEKDTAEIMTPLHLVFQTQPKNMDFQPVADPSKAFLDFHALRFPLKIRKWKQGDRFKPLGMNGQMKLSDFFITNKFSLPEKEKTWLLTDATDEIIWIIGHRIAQPHRIKPATKTVYTITWLY